MGLGWLLGTTLLVRVGAKRSKGKMLLLGVFMDGITFLPLVAMLWFPSSTLAFGSLFLHGIFIPLITVSRASIIHEFVPAEFQGRVFSLINLTLSAVCPSHRYWPELSGASPNRPFFT